MLNYEEKQKKLHELLINAGIHNEVYDGFFNGATLEKVEISNTDKTFNLFIELPTLIPADVFRETKQLVKEYLKETAETNLYVRFPSVADNEVLLEYWPEIIEYFQLTPSIYVFLKGSDWLIEDNKVVINVQNQATLESLVRRRIHTKIADILFYFIDAKYEVVFAAAEIEESVTRFKQDLEQEDMNLALEATINRPVEEASPRNAAEGMLLYGRVIHNEPKRIKEIVEEDSNIVIAGYVFSYEIMELRSGKQLIMFNLTDYTDSIQAKFFVKDNKKDAVLINGIKNGMYLKIKGDIQFDRYSNDLVMMVSDLNQLEPAAKKDNAEEKRVELHLHTNMSAMDGVTSVKKYIEQASKWGHKAIAVTDHGVVQAFPEAYEAGQKYGVKVIYGLEANVVDDGVPIVHNEQSKELLNDTYVIFDTETTGLSAVYNKIIEIGAVKIKNGKVIDKFATFVDPKEEISAKITEITGITTEMVSGAPLLTEALRNFRGFVSDSILVAHNARFDIGFINMGYKGLGEQELTNPLIDTVELARFLYPRMKNYKLNTLCKAFNIKLENHHRAYDDAEAAGYLLWKMIIDLQEKEITDLIDINRNIGKGDFNKLRPFHMTILVKNEVGLKNLYKIVSASHIEYFYRNPRIPRSFLVQHREGLLFGTACNQGELFEALLNKTPEEVEEIAKFYDYFEIQPLNNYKHLIKKGILQTEKDINDIQAKIIKLGEKLNIPVVATGDVHHLDANGEINRKILAYNQISGFRYHDPNDIIPLYYLSTEEMFEQFSEFDTATARKIIIENPNIIAEQIESLKPFPDDLFAPEIAGADEEIRSMSYVTAREIYGETLPELVEKRLEKELNSIINHGFAVIYLISHKLVNKSLEDGYLVGSRGSVGSSFVATMTRITEVNPLPPHYICPKCKHSEFILDGSYGSGFDLPDKKCPACHVEMKKDGHDIPFETFMGFQGDKVPDIDLNFSGEYQPKVHKYTEELFGSEYVYRAGTISTVAEKTAYGYVKKYLEENEIKLRNAEIARLVEGCTGIKRTTGQHPGGLMVIPQYKDVFDFTPIQRPADDSSSDTTTTHFDYHAISGRLLKLDILGHDDPTVIRMLQDLTGIDPKSIPIDDKLVYEIFRSTEPLGVKPEDINTPLGALGIPEFGTKFVRQMLEDTKPTTFSELVRISGLSHGTDVWLNNAQDLIRQGKAVLSDVISTRDDIMVYLIQKGLEPSLAFKIMEKVRKGKGLQPDDIEEMKKYNVPDWYITSCQRIKYMFPKAHAVAYVLMAIRIAYFKVYYPIYYYATYFSVRADEFDIKTMVLGKNSIRKKIEEITNKGIAASPKEKGLLTVLELALEMVSRGFSFNNVDLYKSDATKFIVAEDMKSLIPPFTAIPGIGVNAAKNIVNAREEGEILSQEDFQTRAKASKTTLELLEEYNCLKGLPQSNQLSLF